MISNMLIAIAWVAASLFVAFKTTAVYEYLKILPLPERITHLKEYQREQLTNFSMSYKLFLEITYDTFLNRLLTCPYCVGFWLSLGFSWFFTCVETLPVVYLGSLISYYCISASINRLEKLDGE